MGWGCVGRFLSHPRYKEGVTPKEPKGVHFADEDGETPSTEVRGTLTLGSDTTLVG